MMKTRQGLMSGYHGQAMVSPLVTDGGTSGMLVTAVDLVDNSYDNGLLVPMMEQAEEITGTKAAMTLADSGYFTGSDVEECFRRGQQVVMPEQRQKFVDDPYHKDRFVHDETSDTYTCPQGQTLHFLQWQFANRVSNRVYRSSRDICERCPAHAVCTSDGLRGRRIVIGPHDTALRRHRAWMSTDLAKQAYQRRQQLVEPVFGIVKSRWESGDFYCVACATFRPNGPRWPQLSTCAHSGTCGVYVPSPFRQLARSLGRFPILRRCRSEFPPPVHPSTGLATAGRSNRRTLLNCTYSPIP